MTHLALASLTMLMVASGAWIACSNSSGAGPTGSVDGGGSGSGSGGGSDAAQTGDAQTADAGLAPALACADTIASVYGDPGADFATLKPGAIIRCAHDTDIPLAALQTKVNQNVSSDTAPAQNIGYMGKPLTSGVHIYRVLYRTERGDTANSPGYSSAEVLIPDTPRANDLPILVASHGSRGQAGTCTASQEFEAGTYVNGDYEALGLPLAGLGYVVILPDLAGYSNFGAAGNPPSAYAGAADVGKSTLDGARALKNLVTSGVSDKVVIIGHSQGGHTAFSAVAMASTYAPDLNLAAAAAYSPLWISQATWGAILFEPSSYPLATNPGSNAVAVWYHYTHATLLDGPDAGLEVFDPSKAAQISNFVNNDCWGQWSDLQEAGATAADLFSSSFSSSIAKPAAGVGAGCSASDTTCNTWMARYAADRPHISTSIPFLIEYGGQDETIPADRMACVIQRLGPPSAAYPTGDNVNLTFCLDPPYGHEGIVRAHSADVADWIAAQTLGAPQPPPCTYNQNGLIENEAGVIDPTDDGGTPVTCAVPPPN
jgi:pimeloyl-ACP methyl ester carboxylesterase